MRDTYLIDPVINSGTAPFNFDWGVFGNPNQLEVSEPGIYTLTVVDSNGCSDTHNIELFEKALPQISMHLRNISLWWYTCRSKCLWSSDLCLVAKYVLSSDTGSTIEISTLSSITYTLEGIDSIGCSSTILVPTTATDDFSLDVKHQAVSCQGYSNGSITILPQSTAISPIQYSIDGGQNYFDFFTFDNLRFW